MPKNILDKIIEFDKIVIFKHISPDGDCMFSNLALYQFIKDNFKDKTVKLAGFEDYDVICKKDQVSDKFISEALCIILDTSTAKRIDDVRALNGAYTIKIDHHPFGEMYADLNCVSYLSSAACEYLAEILFSRPFKEYKVSNKVCEYLYSGIVTDTLNFRTTNVTYKTLSMASKLIKLGNFNPAEVVEFTMDHSLQEFKQRSIFRNKFVIDGCFGYVKIDKDDLKQIGADSKKCKTYIDEIGTIKDLKVWCVATINDDGLYEVSLRSKRGYIINTVAMEFGGGGHDNAAGAKGLDDKQLDELFTKLLKVSKTKIKINKK